MVSKLWIGLLGLHLGVVLLHSHNANQILTSIFQFLVFKKKTKKPKTLNPTPKEGFLSFQLIASYKDLSAGSAHKCMHLL
jgi:hypothetical protein